MQRIFISILLGFFFPIAGLAALAFIGEYLPPVLTSSNFYGRPAPGILLAPFLLPMYFGIYLNVNRILPEIFDTFWFRFLSLILFDWILYGTIFYFVLGRFKRFKKKTVEASPEPPAPPLF